MAEPPVKSPGKLRNLRDLAREVGVTPATVSMALHNSPRLSNQMRDRICRIARENGFTPRAYRRKTPEQSRFGQIGPVAVLFSDSSETDPVRDGIVPVLLPLLNERRIDYKYVNSRSVLDNPAALANFRGVIFYNDYVRHRLILPAGMPAAQIFGWNSLGPHTDRVTANDLQVVELAAQYLCRRPIDRAVLVWCREMILFPNHPRITGFFDAMRERNIEIVPLVFDEKETEFLPMLRECLGSGGGRIGFFAFNACCGLKLCCALESLGLLKRYAPENLIVCDRSPLLHPFNPRPAMIDLNLPMMTEFALDALCRRIERPELPSTILLQSPKLAES
ncbi:MAG: LacI family DNA-binding transcriptional regulator [Lentisphaeria bacterium]|nr:LacI family DNA-binding transcriptional regulator [Lentisphaeria bacterium]